MSLFWKVLGLVFFAELGDKTQFLMIAMASHYRLRDILSGVSMAIFLLNGLAIAVGILVGGMLPTATIGIVAGVAFLWFAYDSVGSVGESNEAQKGFVAEKKTAALQVFGTFFLAELGDKTQLTALTFSADHSGDGWTVSEVLIILCASCLALLCADIVGLFVGFFLGKTLPDRAFAWISFVIFFSFGIVKLLGGLEDAFEPFNQGRWISIAGTSLIALLFAWLTFSKNLKISKHRDVIHGRAKNTENRESVSVLGYK